MSIVFELFFVGRKSKRAKMDRDKRKISNDFVHHGIYGLNFCIYRCLFADIKENFLAEANEPAISQHHHHYNGNYIVWDDQRAHMRDIILWATLRIHFHLSRLGKGEREKKKCRCSINFISICVPMCTRSTKRKRNQFDPESIMQIARNAKEKENKHRETTQMDKPLILCFLFSSLICRVVDRLRRTTDGRMVYK